MRRLILLAAAFGCPATADEPTPPGQSLFPLDIGNTWTYKLSGQEDRFVVRAVRQEMVGEQTCVRLEASLKDRVVATEHLAFWKNGLYRFREDKEDVEPPLCVLRTPLPPQKRWGTPKNEQGKNEFRLGSRSGTAMFTAKTEEISVLGVKYKTTCVHADVTEGPRWLAGSDTWYAEGVGMVKQSISEAKRPALTLELEKFAKGGGK